MEKEEKSSRYAVMCHLMAIMRIDVDEATHLVAEMDKAELIQFDELGNVGFLLLEGQS